MDNVPASLPQCKFKSLSVMSNNIITKLQYHTEPSIIILNLDYIMPKDIFMPKSNFAFKTHLCLKWLKRIYEPFSLGENNYLD